MVVTMGCWLCRRLTQDPMQTHDCVLYVCVLVCVFLCPRVIVSSGVCFVIFDCMEGWLLAGALSIQARVGTLRQQYGVKKRIQCLQFHQFSSRKILPTTSFDPIQSTARPKCLCECLFRCTANVRDDMFTSRGAHAAKHMTSPVFTMFQFTAFFQLQLRTITSFLRSCVWMLPLLDISGPINVFKA